MATATQVTGPTKGPSKFQRFYNAIGFAKSYNFFLCKLTALTSWGRLLTFQGFIFAGALFGFTLARLMYLNVSGVFCGPDAGANHAAPGECYYYQNFDRYKIGIRLHLYTILRKRCSDVLHKVRHLLTSWIAAALLVVLQFTPAIRQKFRLVHRINGYIIILLALIANVGAIMIAREAFGGTTSTQSWIGALFGNFWDRYIIGNKRHN